MELSKINETRTHTHTYIFVANAAFTQIQTDSKPNIILMDESRAVKLGEAGRENLQGDGIHLNILPSSVAEFTTGCYVALSHGQ